MNTDWTWMRPLLALRQKIDRLVRHGQALFCLSRIASADARGFGQIHRWFDPDTPVEGVLCWIDHQVVTTPPPADPVFDQFVVYLISAESDCAIPGRPIAVNALPSEQVLLRWDGARPDWMTTGRGRCATSIRASRTGLLVVVWAMGVAYGKQQSRG